MLSETKTSFLVYMMLLLVCVRMRVSVSALAQSMRERGEKIGQSISFQLLLNTLHFGNTNSKSQYIKGLEL